MPKKKNKKKTVKFLEKAIVAWLKYDPLISIVVKNDDEVRRDVMLNLLGPKAAVEHFGKFPPRKPGMGTIYPQTVREVVNQSLNDSKERTELIKKLVYWATDPEINGLYIDSHLSRIQIVNSLLGPIFFNSNANQEDLICKGLKYLLVKKQTSIGKPGEQSYEVHDVLLGKIIEILVHNQKVIINKAVKEAEEKMRVHLLRQIQELRGERATTVTYGLDLKVKVSKIVKEKFPLRSETVQHFEEMLEFYAHSSWPTFSIEAQDAKKKLLEIRKPLTLTSEEVTG